MTQKEKAYDEALALMKDCIPNKDGYVCVRPCDIFHELKESEDEMIRKWLIGYFHRYKEDGVEKYANGLKVESIIAWLEKQGEQKPTLRERYENISKSEWFKRTHEGMSCGLDEEQLQVDDFDAELNALLKKYEHLPKEEVAERLRRKMILYVHLLT